MNSTQRKFGLMAATMAMIAMGNEIPQILSNRPELTPDWKRKKCKSCNLFPCNSDRHKWRSKPLSEACEKYEKRK